MTKKSFTGGIDSVLGGGQPAKPSPTKPSTAKAKRATYILDVADTEKLKAIAYWERRSITAVANDMIKSYLKSYEKKNGTIKPIPND
jgi:hypothetical protein